MMKFVPAKAGRLETEQKRRLKPGSSLSLIAAHPHGHQKTSWWSENTSHRVGEDTTAYITDKEPISGANKQIRDKPIEKWAGLINRPSQKGLSK